LKKAHIMILGLGVKLENEDLAQNWDFGFLAL
jgi:hypothetical protein